MTMLSSAPMIMPSQDKVDYTADDYIATLRWGASQYNLSLNNVPLINGGTIESNGAVNYIEEYVSNLQYIYGSQVPANYNFFTLDANGNNTQTPMFRGLDVFKIFNYLHGNAMDIIEPLPKILRVSAYSKDAVSARKNAMDYVKFQIENKVFLGLLQQEFGYGFKAIDRDFQTQEEIDKYFTNFQESMEIGYEQIAKHIAYYNKYEQLFGKGFDYTLIGNQGTVCVEYVNGQVENRIVPCENAIIDYTKGKDIHDDDDFGGEIFQMGVPDVLASWDWTDEEAEEINNIARVDSGAFRVYYQTLAATNLYWWVINNNVPKVTVVKLAWRSIVYEDGVRKQCIRKGTFIGNRWLKDEGIVNGQVWTIGNKAKKRIPYITMTPNLFLGTSISVIGMIKRVANLKDAFITKCIDMSSSAIGKATVIRASKLPDGLRAPDVIAQLKQARVLVIEGEETEDMPNGRNLAESVDLTLDPNIQLILGLVNYFDNAINDYLNIPLQMRGMNSEYKSGKDIQNTQVQSAKGLSYLFKNLRLWMKEVLSYSADLMKLMAPDDEVGRENLSLIVGDAMVELLSMDVVKRMQFEDMLLSLNPTDYVSEQDKVDIANIALQTASSQQPTKVLKNYIKIKQMDSLTSMYNYLEVESYKEEKAAQDRLAQEQQLAMIQNQNNNATQERMTETTAMAGLEKTAMDNEAKLMLGEQKLRQTSKKE